MLKNTVALRVGSLVEIRSVTGYRTIKDVEAILNAFGDTMSLLPPKERIAVVADYRFAPPMSAEAADYFTDRISRWNERITRSAVIVPSGSASAALRYDRVVHLSGGHVRQGFTDVNAAVAWLSDVLKPQERQRLVRFLDEGAHEFALDGIRAAATKLSSRAPRE